MRHLRACGTLVSLLFAIITARAQETLIVVQGGSASLTNTVNVVSSGGYRLNLAVELMPTSEKVTLGATIGTQNLSGTYSTTPFDLSTVGFCVVSRYMFGWEEFNAFARLGLGAQSSTLTYEYTTHVDRQTRFGLMADISGGVMYWFSRKYFVSGDYSWVWLTGSFNNLSTSGIVSLSAGVKL